MKVLNILMVLALGLSVASCGQQNTNSNNNSQYKQFINSHDGVEVKEPNKVTQVQGYNNQGFTQSDTLLTLDSNGTFKLRKDIPEELYGDDRELEGINGEYEVDSRGVLKLKENGEVIAESSYSMVNMNSNSQSSFSLNFIKSVSLPTIQLQQTSGYGGNNFTSFTTVDVPLQGPTTVTR